ncbi:MAG: copper chaperone PCu(A)C [Pseudomonadota bacterium]|nr:hypothetical protein [Pseudomonadales bacterium]MDY6919040.1 copper chaperone PCu(A)C [Pseudomonadota bacterium]
MRHMLLGALLWAVSGAVLAQDLRVSDGWVREVPPVSANTAAYFTLHNDSGQPRLLLSAQSAAATAVELHTSEEKDGMSSMRRLERVEVPANGQVAFRPGGHHVMLIGLNGPLKQGQEVGLTLTFEGGETLEVALPVKKGAPQADNHHHHHH